MTPNDIALLALCAIAMWTDIRTQKIKNWLTFPMMLAGVASAPIFAAHYYDGALGLLAALVVAIPGWRFGGAIRAGDVKMLMAAGALLGPECGVRAVIWTYMLGLPCGLLVLLVKGKLGNLWRFWVKKERSDPTIVAHAPVVALGILAARIQPFPDLW